MTKCCLTFFVSDCFVTEWNDFVMMDEATNMCERTSSQVHGCCVCEDFVQQMGMCLGDLYARVILYIFGGPFLTHFCSLYRNGRKFSTLSGVIAFTCYIAQTCAHTHTWSIFKGGGGYSVTRPLHVYYTKVPSFLQSRSSWGFTLNYI